VFRACTRTENTKLGKVFNASQKSFRRGNDAVQIFGVAQNHRHAQFEHLAAVGVNDPWDAKLQFGKPDTAQRINRQRVNLLLWPHEMIEGDVAVGRIEASNHPAGKGAEPDLPISSDGQAKGIGRCSSSQGRYSPGLHLPTCRIQPSDPSIHEFGKPELARGVEWHILQTRRMTVAEDEGIETKRLLDRIKAPDRVGILFGESEIVLSVNTRDGTTDGYLGSECQGLAISNAQTRCETGTGKHWQAGERLTTCWATTGVFVKV
jgi:hypothetical protein